MDMMGWGVGGLLLNIFQLILLKASQQQHANEWRTSEIIYHTKNGEPC